MGADLVFQKLGRHRWVTVPRYQFIWVVNILHKYWKSGITIFKYLKGWKDTLEIIGQKLCSNFGCFIKKSLKIRVIVFRFQQRYVMANLPWFEVNFKLSIMSCGSNLARMHLPVLRRFLTRGIFFGTQNLGQRDNFKMGRL